ncbi:hypothetical protein O9929_12330 [Vibrio lentus]|nr:hypothetical protein [Vibrio lentus]
MLNNILIAAFVPVSLLCKVKLALGACGRTVGVAPDGCCGRFRCTVMLPAPLFLAHIWRDKISPLRLLRHQLCTCRFRYHLCEHIQHMLYTTLPGFVIVFRWPKCRISARLVNQKSDSNFAGLVPYTQHSSNYPTRYASWVPKACSLMLGCVCTCDCIRYTRASTTRFPSYVDGFTAPVWRKGLMA